MKGLIYCLFKSFYQSTLLKKGWFLISAIPLWPSLFSGFLWMSRLTKSTLSLLQPKGGISSNLACLDSIFSLISLRFAPTYGRYVLLIILFLSWTHKRWRLEQSSLLLQCGQFYKWPLEPYSLEFRSCPQRFRGELTATLPDQWLAHIRGHRSPSSMAWDPDA